MQKERTVEDRLLDRLEAAETQNFAIRQRRELGWEGLDRIDPLAIESIQELWTVSGRAPFRMCLVDEDKIRGRLGHTKLEGSRTVVRIQERTRRKAFFGDGYSRFLIAKEIGHATLAHATMRAALLEKHRERLLKGSGDARRILVSASCSMEFQASVFAATLLVGRNATPDAFAEDLSVQYGIDALSARVFFSDVPAMLAGPAPRSGR